MWDRTLRTQESEGSPRHRSRNRTFPLEKNSRYIPVYVGGVLLYVGSDKSPFSENHRFVLAISLCKNYPFDLHEPNFRWSTTLTCLPFLRQWTVVRIVTLPLLVIDSCFYRTSRVLLDGWGSVHTYHPRGTTTTLQSRSSDSLYPLDFVPHSPASKVSSRRPRTVSGLRSEVQPEVDEAQSRDVEQCEGNRLPQPHEVVVE